ncbi:MAG: hypothetical protein AB8G18_07610 [Gammaproteobacteria bacterium]
MSTHFLDMLPKDLLVAIHNNLNQRFFADDKAAAKRLFKLLAHGTDAPFIAISSEQSGQIKSVLRLDLTAFSGKLNFRIFRAALAAHLYRIDQALEAGGDCNIYVDEEDSSRLVYNLPGVTDINGHVNALVSGVEVVGPNSFIVNVMFLPVDTSMSDAANDAAT